MTGGRAYARRIALIGVVIGAVIGTVIGAVVVASRSGKAPPNVLLITIDTVRADRLGCYGYTRHDTTPHLDALARQAVLFERAFSNSSFTPPAHASILTSLYPSEHGLLHWNKHLAGVPTAAELFAVAGYRTAAFSPLITLFKLGLDRGFHSTTSPPHFMRGEQPIVADADAINAAALPFLTARDERPFFAWVHYYDAHRPYGRQGAEWCGRFVERDDPAVGAAENWYQLTPARRAALGLTPEQVALLADHYDGGLAYLDDRLGRLFEALAAAGVLESTLVVVVADHGEVFDEHEPEWFSHDPHLADENVHVPLLLRLPGGVHGGLRVADLVQQIDVLPTLLDLAGIAGPPHASGRSLLPLVEGRRLPRSFVVAERQGNDLSKRSPPGKPPPPPPPEAEVRASRDRQTMLRTETRKLVLYQDREDRRARGWYPVDGTAPESTDLLPSEPQAVKAAMEAVRLWLAGLRRPADGSGDAPPLSPEDLEHLDSLGY